MTSAEGQVVTLSECGITTAVTVDAVKVKRGMWMTKGQLALVVTDSKAAKVKVKCPAGGKVVKVSVAKGKEVQPR